MEKDKFIEKWLSGKLTDAELKEFKKMDDYQLNNRILEEAKHFKASHFSTVDSYEDFKAKTDLKEKKTPVIQLKSFKMLYRIAALFIVSLSVYALFFMNNLTTVKTLASNKTTFELPDASSVTLNAESKASYNDGKWKDKREIKLEGEAFFKVAKGSKFDVITESGTISVLGTQFNVKKRDHFFEVKCFEGIVSVKSNNKSQRLTRGNTFRIVKGIISVDTTNLKQPEWINNKSTFKSVPLYEVLHELERQYDISVKTEKIATERLFTGGFIHNDLEQALQSITVPLDLSYKKDQQNKIIILKMEQ